MPIPILAVALVSLALMSTPGAADVRITHDAGGRIGTYVEKFKQIRRTSANVVIDGDCLSACTLVIAFIPRDRICATTRARLGFHAAWKPGFLGIRVANDAGTRSLWSMYPHSVRQWIIRKGGLSDRLLYLAGAELRSFVPACQDQQAGLH